MTIEAEYIGLTANQLAKIASDLKAENAKLRELIRILHMAYVGATNECESLDESLIWEFSGSIRKDLEKSRAKYEADRHRFDVAMRELGIEVTENE